MKKFHSINNNKIIDKISVNKAYVEGIYNDSVLNRKLGRVGMGYMEYERHLKEEKEKKEKNQIPENISDLNFKKENGKEVASYKINNSEIKVELNSHVKHGDKNFTLTVKSVDGIFTYDNLSTPQLTRQMKILKSEGGKINKEPLYKKIPLTEEELDKKYGNIGFNYVYYKDNLDIKVWMREDSEKGKSKFNIYVVDSDTKKRKSFTNLNLEEAHNKLLEFDLNPNIDKPLSKEQLKEMNRIKMEEKYGIGYENSDNYISPLLEEYKLIDTKTDKIKHSDIKIGKFKINILPTGKYLALVVKEEGNSIQEKLIKISNDKNSLSKELDKIANDENYSLKNEDDIIPTKDIGITFNKNGEAIFQNNDVVTYYNVNPNDKSKIDIVVYDKQGNVLGMDSTNVNNFKNVIEDLELNIDKENQVSIVKDFFKKNNGIPAKDLVENYSNPNVLANLPNVSDTREKFDIQDFESILSKKGLVNNKWNKNKREVYAWLKSQAFINWLNNMPNSNKGISKRKIYEKMIENADRIYPNSNDKWSSGGVFGFDNIKQKIVKEFY